MTGSNCYLDTTSDCSSQSSFRWTCFSRHFQQPTEWGALSKEQLQQLDKVGLCRNYKSGEVLFHQGDKALGIYYVRNGLACIRKYDARGNSCIIGRLAFPGNSLGLRPLLAGEEYRGSAETLTSSTVCFVRASVVLDLIKSNSDFEHRVMQLIAKSLGEAEDAYFQNTTQSAQFRLAHLLLLLNDHYGKHLGDGSTMIDLPLTWRNISALIGVRPESMSRVIRKLEIDGIANFNCHTVHVLKIERLLDDLDPDRISKQHV